MPLPKIRKLIIATTALEKSEKISDVDYETLWLSKGAAFITNDSKHVGDKGAYERLRCLFRGYETLEKGASLAACALRLGLLFLTHEIDQLASLVSKEELKSKPNTKRKTLAIDKITTKLELDRNKVREYVKRASTYLEMAEEGGVGCLLMMGECSSK